MSERSLSVNPVIEPCAGGIIGLGIGYSLAPRKYALQSLLILNNNRFQKLYPEELIKNMNEKELQALRTIQNARSEYRAARKTLTDDIKTSARTWKNLFGKVEIPEQMKQAYETSRLNLRDAIKETDYTKLNQEYRKAKAALKNAPEDTNLSKALTIANKNLAKAKLIISSKIDMYKESVANISHTRLQEVKNKPTKYADVREAYHNLIKALSQKRTTISNKLFNLTKDKNIMESYEVLSTYLPKARTRAAISGALITGLTTGLLMLGITNSKKRIVA